MSGPAPFFTNLDEKTVREDFAAMPVAKLMKKYTLSRATVFTWKARWGISRARAGTRASVSPAVAALRRKLELERSKRDRLRQKLNELVTEIARLTVDQRNSEEKGKS